jgi:peptidoglycan/LPS O-acetylase OafA/YrhL
VGYFLALVRRQIMSIGWGFGVAIFLIGLGTLAQGLIQIPPLGTYPNNNVFSRFIELALPCGAVVTGALALESVLPRLIQKLHVLGDMSYALYLVHVPIIVIWYRTAERFGMGQPVFMWTVAVLCFVNCMVAGALFHWGWELRLIRLCRKSVENLLGLSKRGHD